MRQWNLKTQGAYREGHTIDCGTECRSSAGLLCRVYRPNTYRAPYRSPARWTIQALLCGRSTSKAGRKGRKLIRKLRSALDIVENLIDPLQRTGDQRRLYATCCTDDVFNNLHSALLAEAVFTYIGLDDIESLGNRFLVKRQHQSHWEAGLGRRKAEFWVALAACILGNPKLLQAVCDKSISDFCGKKAY